MNLFGGTQAAQKPATPPSIDAARATVETLKQGQGLRGRAAALLVSGSSGQESLARRTVTGN